MMVTEESTCLVVKIGGSLTNLSDLKQRLGLLFRQLRSPRMLVVPGGGEAANLVRGWQSTHGFSDESAHRLAIDSMSLTGRLLEQLMPDFRLAASRCQAKACWAESLVPIADTRPLLEELNNVSAEVLPVGWHVTSDSIAAWIAMRWPADRLVLVKSIDCPAEARGAANSANDAVDEAFRTMAASLSSVLWCNLRDAPERLVEWKLNDSKADR